MSSRKTLSAGVAALGIAIALAGCGADRGGPASQSVDNGPAVSPVAAAGDAAADPYASGVDVEPTDSAAAAEDGSVDGYGTSDAPADESSAPAEKSAAKSADKSSAKGAATSASRNAARLVSTEIPRMGNVVTDKNGWVLYRFDKDKPSPATSNCAGACATTWPPAIVEAKPQLKGVDAAKVGMIKRADGTWQVTLAGWPLYYYAKDAKPGDWKGQGVGGTWFAVTKDGKKNLTCLPDGAAVAGAAAAQKAQKAQVGRVAAELVGMKHPQLGNVVTDEKGSLLYRFDKDKPEPPTTNCKDGCATTWPPVLVKGMPKLKYVEAGLVGAIKRPEGTWQVTLDGWPLYYYSKDVKAGEWKGQGVGGTWFVVQPDGKKNTNCIPAANMAAVEAARKAEQAAKQGSGAQYATQGSNQGYAQQGYGGSGY